MGVFGACSAFTHVLARQFAESPQGRPVYVQGFLGIVISTKAWTATGWLRQLAGWVSHPLDNNTFARRTLMKPRRTASRVMHPHWPE